ncbi:MAG: hypothetical protein IKN62_05420 [Elusimicrobia bacterium]|nr:hypothetical protein [Elusimicrobiota bacterium]
MTPEETMQLIEQKQGLVNGKTNELEQGDYVARKEIDELYGIIKTKFPDVLTPIYDKYLANEQLAQTLRSEIHQLKDEIEQLKRTLQ